ncbi:hypothetical protein GN244_ATG16394 [Phytophthora infestans]|uniref:Uncharacterized protein n=1 Tax=Phytophthora infestans TaxID=4787 RepID=A0A833SL63_PHYIN|nr:hypothetical protein GN244_ATG16394 [Phytophthora infestans]
MNGLKDTPRKLSANVETPSRKALEAACSGLTARMTELTTNRVDDDYEDIAEPRAGVAAASLARSGMTSASQ